MCFLLKSNRKNQHACLFFAFKYLEPHMNIKEINASNTYKGFLYVLA